MSAATATTVESIEGGVIVKLDGKTYRIEVPDGALFNIGMVSDTKAEVHIYKDEPFPPTSAPRVVVLESSDTRRLVSALKLLLRELSR